MHRTNMNDSLFDNELCAKQISAEKIEAFKKVAKGKQLQNLINSDVYQAQEISKGEGVNIAIINSGVDWDHPEIHNNFEECLGVNYICMTQGVKGKSIYHMKYTPEEPMDESGHGTAVAGVISGKTIGIAPLARLYAIKVADRENKSSAEYAVQGILWCINKGVDIINLSVGYKLPNARLRKVCIEAYKQGIILVASAGNNCSGASFPATYKEVISVGAIDENKKHCTFSNIWPSTDVSAPGQNIFSLKLKDKKYDQAYALYSGTSFAAPHITGALALAVSCLKKNKKKFEPKILKQILKETAHKPQQDTKELEKLIKEFGLDLMDQQIQPEEMLRYMYGAGTLNTTAFLKKVIQQYNI